MRSALLSVKGVARARVSLENHEAVVDYDPAQCTVEQMIAAVGKAEGIETPGQYKATVKKKKGK